MKYLKTEKILYLGSWILQFRNGCNKVAIEPLTDSFIPLPFPFPFLDFCLFSPHLIFSFSFTHYNFQCPPIYEEFSIYVMVYTGWCSKARSCKCGCSLILYTLTPVCTFSIRLPRHFLKCWKGEFVLTIRDFFSWSFPLFSWSQMNDSAVQLSGETRC